MVAKRYDAGNETVVRVDPSGAASNDTWTGNQIDHYLGDHWTGSGPGVVLAAYSAAPVAEAAAQGTGPKGNPQHNGTTDPGMMLVAYQDCHKSNAENTLYARYPSYSLRLPTDKSSVPQQNFTVFEYIARLASKCHIQGYGSLNPCQYADGSLQFPYNVFEDEISTGIAGGSMDRTQYFLYGLPNQRLYGVKEIYRTLPDGSMQVKAGSNHITATPGSDPLIDGQLDPWLAPWDGTPQSCNSAFSLYFP